MGASKTKNFKAGVHARLQMELVLRSPPAAIVYFLTGILVFFQRFGTVHYDIEIMLASAVVAIVSAVRFIIAKRILKKNLGPEHRLYRAHAIMIAINAIAWGWSFSIVALDWSPGSTGMLFAMVCLSAFSAGSITSLSPVPSVFHFFAFATSAAPTLIFTYNIVTGRIGTDAIVWAISFAFQALYMIIQGKQVRGNLTKRYEAEELLRLEKIELEETNESLRKTRRDLDIQTAKAQNSAKFAALGTMAGGVAHEINNPLAMIVGHASHILDKTEDKSDDRIKFVYEKGLNITKAADRIATIIRGLRVFSREAEADPFVKTKLAQIVEDTLSFCREKLQRDGIELKVEVDPSAELECRPVQLSQVLLNLLNNATDAVQAQPKKQILIRGFDQGDHVFLSVEDTGRGVDPLLSQKIFEPFFTTKEVGAGTGLGLSISKSIVEEHKGELTLSPKHASRFELFVPKHHRADQAESGQSKVA